MFDCLQNKLCFDLLILDWFARKDFAKYRNILTRVHAAKIWAKPDDKFDLIIED